MHLSQIMRSVFNYTSVTTTNAYARDPSSRNNLFIPFQRSGTNEGTYGSSITASGNTAFASFMLPGDYSSGLVAKIYFYTMNSGSPMYLNVKVNYVNISSPANWTTMTNTDQSLGNVNSNTLYPLTISSYFSTISTNYFYQVRVAYSSTVTTSYIEAIGVYLTYIPTS